MKKWITLLTMLLLMASLSATASAAETDDHVHSWGPWQQTVAPTCSQEGQQSSVCTVCGETGTQSVAKLPHSWDTWQQTVAPTCSQEGQQSSVCTVCGETGTQSIAKLPHNWGPWQEIAAATCDKEGSKTHSCSVCGEVEDQIIEKLPHKWGRWTTVKEATCTEKGVESHSCSLCQQTETRETDFQHDWGAGHVVEAPTCTEVGKESRRCIVCKERATFILRVIDHTAGETIVENEVPATCTTEGSREKAAFCTMCGMEMRREVITLPALGHNWSQWEEAAPASCTEAGQQTRSCTLCQEIETHEIPANGHLWQYVPSQDEHTELCSVCGDVGRNDAHVFNKKGYCICGQRASMILNFFDSPVMVGTVAAAIATVSGILLTVTKKKCKNNK